MSSSVRPAAITRARDARRPGISSSGSIVIVTRSSGSRPRFASSAATLPTVVSITSLSEAMGTEEVTEWGIAALHRAAEDLPCKTAVHICYGYGIKANIDWKSSLEAEWRQYEAIFPALATSRIDQVSVECAGARVPLDAFEKAVHEVLTRLL